MTSGVSISFFIPVAVGVAAGLWAVGFRKLIQLFQWVFFTGIAGWFGSAGHYAVIVLPAIGGLLVGLLVYYFAREAKGHGVPEVMLAVARQGGRIRARVAIVKAIASSICIGSGGSAGREGPIVQIGSTVGSFLGQRLRLSEDYVKTLVACGAAGGISATFNAPLAGVFFALEVILRRVSTRSFGLVVLSAVVADLIAIAVLGRSPAFLTPSYTLNSHWEVPLYMLLGVGAGLVGVFFFRALYFTEDIFEKYVKLPEWLLPALGGLAVGGIGFFYPQLFGVGYESMDQALGGNFGIAMLLALGLLKIMATSFTLGSGGSGGVFAPSLFMGTMLGAAYGQALHGAIPGVVAQSGGYSIVGMAALFAGAARAPIAAILIVFEMTRDYAIILPLMLAVVTATAVSRLISRDTIYTMKLSRRGIDLSSSGRRYIENAVLAGDVMSRDHPVVQHHQPVRELLGHFESKATHGFPVLDDRGELVGIVTLADVQDAMSDGRGEMTAGDIATTTLIITYPDIPVQDILKKPGAFDLGRIPVVDRNNRRRLLGVLRREDIVRAYVAEAGVEKTDEMGD